MQFIVIYIRMNNFSILRRNDCDINIDDTHLILTRNYTKSFAYNLLLLFFITFKYKVNLSNFTRVENTIYIFIFC
jgi:hypothetical protein